MNIKRTVLNPFILPETLFRCNRFLSNCNFFSVHRKKIEKLEKNVLDYYSKENDNFVKKRRKHEKTILEYFGELNLTGATVTDVLAVSGDTVYIQKTLEEIRDYVKIQNENYESNEHEEKIKEIKDKTDIMKILVTCGIRVEPKILFYFLYRLLLYLRTNSEKHKNVINIYNEVKDKKTYFKINNYYYHKDIYNIYVGIYKSLSNVLFTICENFLDKNEIYIIIKKEIEDTHLSIDDFIRKAPSFLNISILFFYINIWLFVDKSRKIKNTCLDYLNAYLSSISADEVNMSTDDLFYLFLTFRLFFCAFSYNEVLNNLNNFSKQFLSSVVFFPHNSESFVKNENINYSYVINFLNKHEKYVEHKEVPILPFHFSLASLKNKTVYIAESKNDYYQNEAEVIRACHWWRYLIAKHEGYQLLFLCKKNEFDDFISEKKRDELLQKYINADYLYQMKNHDD